MSIVMVRSGWDDELSHLVPNGAMDTVRSVRVPAFPLHSSCLGCNHASSCRHGVVLFRRTELSL